MSMSPTLSPTSAPGKPQFNLILFAGFISGAIVVSVAAVIFCCRRFQRCREYFMGPGQEPLLATQQAESENAPNISSNSVRAITPLAVHRAESANAREVTASDPQERARNAASLLGVRIT